MRQTPECVNVCGSSQVVPVKISCSCREVLNSIGKSLYVASAVIVFFLNPSESGILFPTTHWRIGPGALLFCLLAVEGRETRITSLIRRAMSQSMIFEYRAEYRIERDVFNV